MRSRTSGSCPAALSSSQRAAVRRSCQTIALCSGSPAGGIPDAHGLALVGDAHRRELPGPQPGVGERLSRDRVRHLPDLAGVVLDPARLGEVLGELAVGPADRLGPLVEHQAGGAGRSLIDREDHLRREPTAGRGTPARSPPAGGRGGRSRRGVRPLARWVEVELDLGARGAPRGPRRSSSPPPSRSPARTAARRSSTARAQRPLPGDRRRRLEPAAPADRPAREADARARSRRPRAREGRHRQVRLAARGPRRRARPARRAESPRSPSQSRKTPRRCPRLARRAGPGAGRSRGGRVSAALADHPLAAHHPRARPAGELRRGVGGAVVGDPHRRAGKGRRSAASVAPMRSASLRAATITQVSGAMVGRPCEAIVAARLLAIGVREDDG